MSLISKMRRQDAVLWQRISYTRQGVPIYGAPVAIRCRWEDVTQEYLSPQGQRELSSSVVYVSRDVAVGDRLALGELSSDTPLNPLDAKSWEVKQFLRFPNLKNTELLRTAYL